MESHFIFENESNNRSVHINFQSLRRIRRSIGWTQQELARRSGYSERLIRKAEQGGPLDLKTVRDIAQALSVEAGQVEFSDLVQDPLSIAKLWVRALNELGSNMASAVAPFYSRDFVLSCPGDPSVAPFIGTWEGIEGFQQFMDLYFSVFRRVPHDEVTFTVGENLVSARWLESGYLQDQLVGPVRINMHFHFRHGIIYRIDDEYDIMGGASKKAAAEEKIKVSTA